MLKNLIGLSLATVALLGSLGIASSAQQAPILARAESNISQPQFEPDILSVITQGFDAFCSGKTDNPFSIWSEHTTPIIRDVMTSNQMIQSMNQMFQVMIGKCIGYSVINSTQLTEKTQIIYIESDHEKAPLFWRFTVYRSPEGWVISSFGNNTNPAEILPPNIMIGG